MKRITPWHWPGLLTLALCLILSAGCSKAAKAKRLLASADVHFQAKKYDAAEIEYKSVLGLSLLNPVAIRQLGFIYYEEGRSLMAFRFLQEALKQDPNNTEVQLKMAELYASGGELKRTQELLGSVLHADPGNEHALSLLAESSPTNDLASVVQRLETQLREGGQGEAACHSALGWIDLRLQKLSEAEQEFKKASELDPKLTSPYIGQVGLCTIRHDTKGMDKALQTAAELSPIRSPIRLKYAEFKMQTGSEEEGTKMVREITREAPDYIPAWLFLMKAAFAEHKYDECKTNAESVLARDNLNYDAMLQSGILALTQGDGAKAVAVLKRLSEVYKSSPQVKYNLAEAYLMNNERPKAVASLNEALALNHDFPQAALLLAELDYRSGNLSESATLLSESIKSHPEDGAAQIALAETYLAQEQPERAMAVYARMARMFPKNPEIPRRMGMVYQKYGDSTRARAALEKSLELAPAYLPTLQEINRLDIAERRYETAHRRVAAVVAQNPKSAEPLVLQGDIYLNEGRTNEAESAYAKAIELNPELSTAYLSLAQVYLQTRQEKRALDRLDALAAKHTNDVTALMMIGFIHQAAGRYEQARDAYLKVLAVDPNSSNSFSALNNLAYVDSEYLGKLDDALQLATKARQLRPYDPHVADTLGWILFKKGEYAHALSVIQESAEKQPSDPEVQMHLGMAHYMMGEEQAARLCLGQALASQIDFPDKDMARRRLEVLNIDPATATPEVIQKLQSMVHEDPKDPVPLSRLAAIEELHGEVQKAADSLESLISINPQDWSAMIRLSRLYADHEHLDDPHKALKLATKAHDLAPSDDGSASALLGELVYQNGDYPWALNLLDEAAHRSPGQPSLFYHLALAYYAVGRTADADEAMAKAVQQQDSPSHIEQAKQFIALREALKDPAKASGAQVERILAKDPNNVPALMVSALLTENKGQTDEAEKICQKVLTIYPLFAPAMRQLAMLYSRSQNPSDLDTAYDWAEKARVALPDDLELAKTLGLLTYHRKEYNSSMLFLRQYADKSADDGEAFYYLGMDYYELKKTNTCKQALNQALALHVADPLKAKAQGILKELQ
jgi:tetratricopeptide (TPR) repeat protein